LFHIRIAKIIDHRKLNDIENFTTDFKQIVEESFLKSLQVNTLSWVLKAPVLGIITDSLEVANFSSLIESVNEVRSSILHKKVRDDIWSVSIDDVKNAGSDLVNALYKTAEVCDFERVGDDAKNRCLENPGQCFYLEGLEERLFDNLFEIGGEVFDIIKLSMVDDLCYSDMEQMGEIYRFSADIGELTASGSGFDYKWDKSIERKHIKRSSFHK
jgi:hypothetical protein